MAFLANLADQISNQFNLNESTTSSLDSVLNGQQSKNSSLGDVASKFNKSTERRYVEEGYLRRDPFNTDPKAMEILLQEPSATILVKKKMFSSISENFRPDFMDQDEKLYYKAMTILFQNKCNQISALEKLSKIQKITASVGQVDTQLIPWIITLADAANNGYANGTNLFGALGNNGSSLTTQDSAAFIQVVNRLRTLFAFNQTNPVTTWIKDPTSLFKASLGQGTGVIELTNFMSINTTTTTSIELPGKFTFTISDPYESMLITDNDIENAISDATNSYYNKKSFQLLLSSAEQVIADQQNQLNALRANRNASHLTFNIGANVVTGQQVTVIIDSLGLAIPFTYDSTGGTGFPGLGGSGNSVSVPSPYLEGGSVAGYDGLSTGLGAMGPDGNIKPLIGRSELTVFQNLIAAINNKLQLTANTSSNFVNNMQYTNYTRKKMRFLFSGKLIIQPMDTVHIYLNSKSRYDNKIFSGLNQMFSGSGILQNMNNTINDFTNTFSSFFAPSGGIPLQVEKATYVGASFPNYLWSLLRNQFVTEKEGTHVFAGLVEKANDAWSAGKFTVTVNGTDNSAYFKQGKVNFKPGMDNFNGAFFDPLTPFKTTFDNISTNTKSNTLELLDENKQLLSDSAKNSLVKNKLGPYSGEKATQGNYLQDRSIDPSTNRLTKVFYAPDGLVYKWKEGIGVFTQFGGSTSINDPNLVGNYNTFAEPFAGLDVMNVISLLVTGVPYNFATYFKATGNLPGFTNDPQSKQDAAYSFTNSLKNDLVKNNVLWGNFIPFKSLTLNEATLSQMKNFQMTITNGNNDLDQKLQQLSQFNQQAASLAAGNALAVKRTGNVLPNTNYDAIIAQANNLQYQINDAITNLTNQVNQFSAQNNALNSSFAANNLVDGKSNPSKPNSRQDLRKQINYLTRRMSYDVRANQDKNLFIVDDYYDADYDITAFNTALADGVKLYNNEFDNVNTKIVTVANLLNLEVFCDSQGHIRARQPQYNRMPSSIFYRMMYLQQTTGMQVFPKFLSDMFNNQLESLKNQIEVLEDQIRLDCAILGQMSTLDNSITGDPAAIKFIDANQVNAGNGNTFSFLSQPNGLISDINNLIQNANPDPTGLLQGANLGSIQGNVILAQALYSQLQNLSGTNVTSTVNINPLSSTIVQQLITRINTKSGQNLSTQDYITTSTPDSAVQAPTNPANTVNIIQVTTEMGNYLQQWQNAVKLYYHTIKNAQEYKSIENPQSVGNSLSISGIFGNSKIPEVFAHMIQDENYDDYGFGSGKRFVIKQSQIRSLEIAETAPNYTTVEVHGVFNPFADASSQGPSQLNSFQQGGNALTTAFAIDYDLWRNYGFKNAAKLDVPFLSNPEQQCAPYAAMVLSRNRAEVLQGSITISGNEFMQAGEVYFLQNRQMLFYSNSVSHSYVEGSSFTTSMELNYGHSPGDYIPTYLDTVGKLIYKNRDLGSVIIQRQDSSGPDTNIGAVQLPTGGSSPNATSIASGSEDANINPVSVTNATVLNNILYNTAYIINSNNVSGSTVTASVEIRAYYDNTAGAVPSNLASFAQQVINTLTGQNTGPQSNPNAQNGINPTLDPSAVKFVKVNLDDSTDRRSPSQKAIDMARNLARTTSTNNGAPSVTSNQPIRTALFNYVIDCWVLITTNSGATQ